MRYRVLMMAVLAALASLSGTADAYEAGLAARRVAPGPATLYRMPIPRVLTSLLLCATSGPRSLELRCSDAVLITADGQYGLAGAACEAALAASDFLSDAGLDTSTPVTIRLVDTLPGRIDPNAVACYIHSERCVYLSAPRNSLVPKGPTADRIPKLPYRSWVTHEMAHAIAADNFRLSKTTIQAHEYIAYVTMFATMPQTLRDQILGAFPGDGFDNEEQITATLFLLAPNWFGAEAYRHYRSLRQDGPAFLARILSGQALNQANGW